MLQQRYISMRQMNIMKPIEIREKDLLELAKTEVRNLPGALFSGTSPLLKPFMKKLEALLPPESRGKGDSYIHSALPSHIDEVHADERRISIKRGETVVEIRREELGDLMVKRYPTTDHQRLNLPGLLFLQSGLALQTASSILLQREHKLCIPGGRRTMRYVFHMGVASLDADKEKIVVGFDPERLPKRADGSSVLEAEESLKM
jgi:hypothetical protein